MEARVAESLLDTPLVSLVVPVHDPRPDLLARALRSAAAQTYSNLEVLVIDDGSRPDIARQLDEIARCNDRICVKHQSNRGVSAARNHGILLARGTFVGFLDADDFLSEDFVASALAVVRRTGADIAFGQLRVHSRGGDAFWRVVPAVGAGTTVLRGASLEKVRAHTLSALPSPDEDFPAVALTNVVGALYRVTALRHARFPEGVAHGEDRVFNAIVLGQAGCVAVASQCWYTYDRTHGDGVTQRFSPDRVPELQNTIEWFARAGGLQLSDLEGTTGPELREGAARGILSYLKLAVSASAEARGVSGAPALAALVQAVHEIDLAAALPRTAPVDQIVLGLASRQWVRPLIVLGKAQAILRRLGRPRAARPS